MISGEYIIREVNGARAAEVLNYLNAQMPELFPPLKQIHFDRGYWWLMRTWNKAIVGFAGMVPNIPFDEFGVGYLKRAYVAPAHRGQGLQLKLLRIREAKAREIGWTMLVAECGANTASQNNFIKAGYIQTEPEQSWGARDSVYFVKRL